MSFIAAAIIGGGASLLGAGINAYSSSKASQAQVGAQTNALNAQQGMFNTAKGALDPFITAGKNVLPQLSDLLTPGKSANALSSLPGFQFASNYGTMAATNALTSRGLGASAGPVAAAVSQYNTGLASQSYMDYVKQLMGYAGMGSSAAGSLAGNALGFGKSMAGTFGNIGNAQGAGYLGVGNALSGGLTGGSNAITNSMLLSKFLPGGGGGGMYGGVTYPGNALQPGPQYGPNPFPNPAGELWGSS